jgi:hypothetical protein
MDDFLKKILQEPLPASPLYSFAPDRNSRMVLMRQNGAFQEVIASIAFFPKGDILTEVEKQHVFLGHLEDRLNNPGCAGDSMPAQQFKVIGESGAGGYLQYGVKEKCANGDYRPFVVLICPDRDAPKFKDLVYGPICEATGDLEYTLKGLARQARRPPRSGFKPGGPKA